MVRKLLTIFSLLLVMACFTQAAELSPDFELQLKNAAPDSLVAAIVILESPVDIMSLDMQLHKRQATLAERHREVYAALKYNASQTQPAFQAELDAAKLAGHVSGYTAYWIENLFVVYAQAGFLNNLRERGDIKCITENFRAELIEPVPVTGLTPNRGGRNPLDTEFTSRGQEVIRATEVNRVLGITGQGVLVGNVDTGVDQNHPALASRWRGRVAPPEQCWHDATYAGYYPTDDVGHGTHVMGIIAGREIRDDGDTITVGSAPDALWIGSNLLDQNYGDPFENFENDVVSAYQWFFDPDHNPETLDDVPDVIQNSWGIQQQLYGQCYPLWNGVITNCEAGGPVTIWSVGNESNALGPRSPAAYSINAYQNFSVGAVDANAFPPFPLAAFSSQGPTTCSPAIPDNIKPEIVAPGVQVYSCTSGGGYTDIYSGTSMSGPHVAGAVALMRQACPNCDHITIKEALMHTAVDYGAPGEDNLYGTGFIDAYEAVLAVNTLGRVCGTVTDNLAQPLAGIRVKIDNGPHHVFTKEDGHYCLPLPEGTYNIEYWSEGFTRQFRNGVNIAMNDTVSHDVVLLQATLGTVTGTVTDCNGNPATGAEVRILNSSAPVAIANAAGVYTVSVLQGVYDIQAHQQGCGDHLIHSLSVGENTIQNFVLTTDERYESSEADAHGYRMYENSDPGGIPFEWLAITPAEGGPGVSIIEGIDPVFPDPISIPFPFRFYGDLQPTVFPYTGGYLTFAEGATSLANTYCFERLGMAAGLFVYWDNLTIGGGDAAYYNDPVNHWFVISYFNFGHNQNPGNLASFQVIIYDEAFYPTSTGDNMIRFQFGEDLVHSNSAVSGIRIRELPPTFMYSQYQCNGEPDRYGLGIAPGRSVLFSTAAPCDNGDPIVRFTTELNAMAPLGGQDSVTLQLCNDGTCPLEWRIDFDQMMISGRTASAPDNPGMNDRDNWESLDDMAVADGFGYSWIDSDEIGGPRYEWFEINTLATETVFPDADIPVRIALPFSFRYLHDVYASLSVSANGFVHFGTGQSNQAENVAFPLVPPDHAPRATIAVLWDNLSLTTSGAVYYYHDQPRDRFIVEWDDVGHAQGTTDRYTFQLMLYENGRILMQYREFTPGAIGVTSCTVGLLGYYFNNPLQVVYNAPYLHEQMAIEFMMMQDWLSFPLRRSGTIAPGMCQSIPALFEARDLPEGIRNGNLQIVTNDPDNQNIRIPVSFAVGAYRPPRDLTVLYVPETNSLRFSWVGSNAPSYWLWSFHEYGAPYGTIIGMTSDTTLTIPRPNLFYRQMFYQVTAGN